MEKTAKKTGSPYAGRIAARGHFRTLRLDTPFQPRIDALMKRNDWYSWAGYRAPNSLWDEELEYFAIRSQAALFDISPMVKYRIEGPDAEAFLNRVTLRDVAKLKPGRVHYTAWCDDEGHVLDDGTLFRLDARTASGSAARSGICPGCSTAPSATTSRWRKKPRRSPGWRCRDRRPSPSCARRDLPASNISRSSISFDFQHQNGTVTISRTGFTGDLGYELFVPAELALSLWDRLMEAGQTRGIRAIGYTALNRARLEAGLIVANADFSTAEHALSADRVRMPDEIGLGFMVDLEKGHFNGRRAIAEARRKKTSRHILVGLEIEGNIPADHAIVYHRKTKEVGLVSAASWSPLAKRNIAIASLYRPFGDTVIDDLWVEIYAMRELKYEKLMKRAKIVPRPFIKLDRRTANPPAEF